MDSTQRHEKMKKQAKSYSFDEFLMHIASRFPIVLHKNNNYISKFPQTQRASKIIHHEKYQDYRDGQ